MVWHLRRDRVPGETLRIYSKERQHVLRAYVIRIHSYAYMYRIRLLAVKEAHLADCLHEKEFVIEAYVVAYPVFRN